MTDKKHIIGNKGEWSEFYVFVKLLDERRIYPAGEDLVVDKSFFYPVLKISRNENRENKKIYDVGGDKDKIKILDANGLELAIIDGKGLKKRVKQIFDEISKAKGRGPFRIGAVNDLFEKLLCDSVKASNNKKADILLTIKDELGVHPEYGYSIKSMIGAASTLLNSSGATNFIYEIKNLNKKFYSDVNKAVKFKDKLNIIFSNGGTLDFKKISSTTFTDNLQLIDNTFPRIMAEFLLRYYKGDGNTFEKLLNVINQNNVTPGLNVSKNNYRHKIKNFLINVALGMVPGTEWDSYMKAYGGYIIVKNDGEICCYQLNKRDIFQDYIYNNVKFDTPSTTKFKFGKIYKESGKSFIKLNLQIRFVK